MAPRALLLAALFSAGTSDVTVSSSDGLTVVAVNETSGDLLSVASPGHVPLAFGAGSGSFIGWNGAADGPAVNPNAIVAPCNASLPSQQSHTPSFTRLEKSSSGLCPLFSQ